ncbi:Schwann cell myelin protein-like isoform X2 [Heterodontus francisci]|uniref:Schwann cell myelin protein-like isoform X2 n=1 Tax=Heterodontus francisci TaxID=7792 RepID=UPI00355BC37B
MSTSHCTLALIAVCLIQGSTATPGWGVSVPDSLFAVQGTSVIFNCSFQYPDKPPISPSNITAKWLISPCDLKSLELYNNQEKNNNHKVSFIGDLSKKNCSLQISEINTTYNGAYCFRFEIKDFNSWTGRSPVHLTVYARPTKPIISFSTELVEGINTSLICSSSNVAQNAEPSLNWYGISDEAAEQRKVNEQIGNLSSYLVFIPSYQDHKKIIKCSVNYSNYLYSDEANITLQVKYAPKNITIQGDSGSQMEIKEGDKVSLTCTSNSFPEATYTWYKREEDRSQTESLNFTGATLTFHNISRRDSGFYNCAATNSLGNETSEALEIRVQYAPKHIAIQGGNRSQLDIKEGDKVSLTCTSNSYPEATYTWYKREEDRSQTESFNFTGATLTFHNISRRDSGFYNCAATNYLGKETSEALEIRVQYKPAEVNISRVGMSFHCTAIANPLAQITWNYTSNAKPVINGNRTNSTLTLQTMSNICVSCQAQNKYGHISSEKQCFKTSQTSILVQVITGSISGAVLLLVIVLLIRRKDMFRGKKPEIDSQPVLHNGPQDPKQGNQMSVSVTNRVYDNLSMNESLGEKQDAPRRDSANALVYASIRFDKKPKDLKPEKPNTEQLMYSNIQDNQVTGSTGGAVYENVDKFKTISKEAGGTQKDSEDSILYACIVVKDNPHNPKPEKH